MNGEISVAAEVVTAIGTIVLILIAWNTLRIQLQQANSSLDVIRNYVLHVDSSETKTVFGKIDGIRTDKNGKYHPQ